MAYADSYAITKECWKGIKKVMTRYGCSLILFFVSTCRNTYHAISILFEIKQQSEIRFHFICNYFVLSKNKDELICWQLKISMKYMARCFLVLYVSSLKWKIWSQSTKQTNSAKGGNMTSMVEDSSSTPPPHNFFYFVWQCPWTYQRVTEFGQG